MSEKVKDIITTLSSEKIKKLFFNANKINKFVEKINNENGTGKAVNNDKKVTKIENLKSPDEGMVDILSKILSFMQKNYDEDKAALEKSQNFAEENAMERDRKRKELF